MLHLLKAFFFVSLLPLVAHAQGFTLNPLNSYFSAASFLEASIIPVLIGAAFITLLIALLRFLWKLGSGENINKNKSILIWGLVAIFVMVSVWGLIKIAQNSLGISGREPIAAPAIPV